MKNAVEIAPACKMMTNHFDVIDPLGRDHNNVAPSLRRRSYDVKDPETISLDPFGGDHVPPAIVEYRRTV